MRHLNYNHLLYFWTVAQEGSVARAAEVLHLAPQTISGQLKMLEDSIGEPLFTRVGRGLAITDTGRIVEQYADEIFNLGAELTQRVRNDSLGAPMVFNVGIVNSIPKLIAYRTLQPVMHMTESMKVSCYEDNLASLLAQLSIHKLDLVLSDRPIPSSVNVRAYNHELGSSQLSIFGAPNLLDKYPQEFPKCLDNAPMLMPVKEHVLRRNLSDWFEVNGLTQNIVAEFDDSALLKVFGEAGEGFFPAPTVMRKQVESIYGVKHVGLVEGVMERFYLISPERKLKHPAVLKIIESTRFSMSA